MTGVTYHYIDNNGQDRTTKSYNEWVQYCNKEGSKVLYEPIYEEPVVNPNKKRRTLV